MQYKTKIDAVIQLHKPKRKQQRNKKMNNAKKVNAPVLSTKQIDDAVAVGKEHIEKTVAATKVQVEKASTAALKSYEDVAVASKETVDGFVSSVNLVSKGFEEISRAYFEMAQKATETQVEAAKAMFAARNVNELLEVQNEFVRNSYDKFSAETAKISEMSLKLANEVSAPIQAQATSMIERTTKQFAA